MNKRVLLVLTMASTLAFAAPAMSQSTGNDDEDTPIRRIRTIGEDGGTYYTVDCKNRRTGSVSVEGTPPQVCATQAGGKSECRAAWRIESAAKFICS